MLKLIIYICFEILLGFTFINAQNVNTSLFDFEEVVEFEKSNRSNQQTFQENQNTQNYDVTYYRLNLNVRPDSHYIQGNVTIFFIPKENIPNIFFDLNNALTIDSILYQNNSIAFEHNHNQIRVLQNFQPSHLDSITLFYQGAPPASASFKTEHHQNTPILWTLSEPYGALDWWPCKQSLLDKADSIDTYVTVPNGNKVAGIGNLINEIQRPDNTTTVHWKSNYPIATYLIAIAVTPYAEIKFQSPLSSGNLIVQNYIYREDSAQVVQQLFATDTLLQFYDSIIGPYPFMNEKYGHAQFGRGGGMEHQTMSFMFHFGFGLTAHELAHQWFGNKITCGSWSDIWLNEGFATYFAGIPYEFLNKDSSWNLWKKTFLERATLLPNGSIYVTDTSEISRIFDPNLSYAKAGYMLHMLRKQIGDTVFFKAVQSYISDPQLIYNFASTDDFFRHIENQSGQDLSIFKNQWIYGQGYPSFHLEWQQKDFRLELVLSQTTSHSSVKFFYLKVPILIESELGDSLWLSIDHQNNNQISDLNIPFKISHITIDPNLDLISKANFSINTTSFTDLSIYPNPSNSFIVISPGGDMSHISEYKIFSLEGKLIKQITIPPFSFPQKIDVSYLAQGEYILTLVHNEKSVSHKLIISK